MSELVDFLTQRLDEDEAVARAATDGGYGWRLTDMPGANEVWADRDASGHDAFMVATTCTTINPSPAERGYRDAAHVARHDPARVLAEVNAKRAILDLHTQEGGIEPDICAVCASHAETYPCRTVRALAQPFAGEPGWRDEWGTQ